MIAVGLSMGLVTMATTWAYRASRSPPPKICGSPGGPPITAPRIKLRDGRHLAYKEHGMPKEMANYKIVFVHGFDSCRHDAAVAKRLSPVLSLLFLFFSSLFLGLFQTFKHDILGLTII